MEKLIKDKNNLPPMQIDELTGFLVAPVTLSRVGVQKYSGAELGLADRATDVINVMRKAEDVFNEDSINSFVNLIVTDDHPLDLVTIHNCKQLQKGMVSNVKRNRDNLVGSITITDKDLINKIRTDKNQVSVGYTHDIVPEKGTYQGVDYEYKQTNIRANHLAVVAAGRCGAQCKIGDEIMKKIKYKGKEYSVDSAEDLQKIQALMDADEEEMKAKEEKEAEDKKKKDEEVEKLKKENEDLKKDKSTKDAELDVLKQKTLDSKAISKMIYDKVNLITKAKDILKDKMLDCEACDREIKAAVIDKVLNLGDLSKKDDVYLDAAFDLAIKEQEKNVKVVSDLKHDFEKIVKDNDGNVVTRDSIREKYLKDKGLEV